MTRQERRRIRRRRVLPGFPWDGQFQTPEQAREYTSGDRLCCLMCGKSYRGLTWHIAKIHGLDTTAYKQKFGIPYGVGLVSAPTSAKMSIGRQQLLEAFGWEAVREKGRQARQAGCDYRPLVSTVRNQRSIRIQAINAAQQCVRQCSLCGCDVTVSGQRTLVSAESIRCEGCLDPGPMSPESRNRLRQWAEDNPERSREYFKAKNWWGWQRNPFPLLAYASKWRARLRILPELEKAAMLANSAESEPTKPSKPGSVGFDGTASADSPKIEVTD